MEKQRVIYVNGQLVAVTEEIYAVFYQMRRRERYLTERDIANGKVLYSDLDTAELLGEETIPDIGAESIEQLVINTLMGDKLRACIATLPIADQQLITELFFNGYSEREYANMLGVYHNAVHKRKVRILQTLKTLLES